MKTLFAIALLTFAAVVHGQTITSGGLPAPTIACDKTVAVTAAAGANMTKVITLSASKPTFVCGFILSSTGAGLVQIKSGTNTTNPCDTTTVAITGNMTTATGGPLAFGSGLSTIFRVAAGLDVCILATTGSIAGFMVYAQ